MSSIDTLYNNIVDIFETVSAENEKSPIKCILYKYNIWIDKLYNYPDVYYSHTVSTIILKLTSPDDPFI